VNSDTLYVLATGFSIVSILVVFVAKYWFGKSEEDEEKENDDDEEVKERVAKGTFGRLPVAEWKQHKSALEKEYRERFMDSPPRTPDHSEKAPLLSNAEEIDVSDFADVKEATPTKVVRFQDAVEERKISSATEPIEGTNEEPQSPVLGEDLEGMLNENLEDVDLAHLPGQLKSVKLRKATKQVEEGLTDEQKQEEVMVRNQQLESILTLMRQQQEKFGSSSMEDIEEQLKLYGSL